MIGGLLEYSDLMDKQLAMRLAAFREGYAEGYADGVQGRQNLVEDLEAMTRRWTVRGKARSRRDFGRPHSGDFRGREGTA